MRVASEVRALSVTVSVPLFPIAAASFTGTERSRIDCQISPAKNVRSRPAVKIFGKLDERTAARTS